MASTQKRGILERLNGGELVIGDGGFVFAMEKRGYVRPGGYTPEVCVEHPEALRQLHREFLRAGADVMQAYTFYASEDKLDNRGNEALGKHGAAAINKAACAIAKEVAAEGNALFLGGICQTPTYLSNVGEKATKEIFRKQVQIFKNEEVDLLLCEYFEHVQETVWAVEVCKEFYIPVAANVSIGPDGDWDKVSPGECAIRLVKAGADIVGVNCNFDPFTSLKTISMMKDALDKAGLKAHLMVQPLVFHTPDCKTHGFTDLPEFPFALEPRICTRWDIQKYARQAYDLGVRYIGGCCGFEPYHIRAIAEELEVEHGRKAKGSEKHDPWGAGLRMHTKPWVRARARKDYWENLNPASGRPYSSACSHPDDWDVHIGDTLLGQHKEETTEDEQKTVFEKKH